jgi:hypothetical protein
MKMGVPLFLLHSLNGPPEEFRLPLSRYNRFPLAVDLNQRVRRDQEEPPCAVFTAEPELGRDCLIPATMRRWAISSLNSSVSCRAVARIAGANMTRVERDRDLRNDRGIGDPLRPAQCHPDDPSRLSGRDRFGERPAGAGPAAHWWRLVCRSHLEAAFLCTRKFIIHGFYLPDCEQTMARKIRTTEQGVPVAGTRRSLTTGARRPALLQDVHLIEIPEMMV